MTDEATILDGGTAEMQGHVEENSNEREKKYKELQSDYTRKTQELANLKKQEQTQEEQDDSGVLQAKQFVKSYLDELGLTSLPETLKRKQNNESFERLSSNEPSLKAQENAIKKIAEVEGISIEEAIINYNFLPSDKLERAKSSRPIVGNTGFEQKREKTPEDMNDQEWKEFKAKIKGRG